LLDAGQNPDLLKRLARNGANVVAEKFDQRKQIQRLEEIYLRTIGDPRKEDR
jgi:glycosyltransferase involved in cell wall biosynthesis